MKKSVISVTLLLLLSGGVSHLKAQSLSNAVAQYNEFVNAFTTSGESLTAYNALYWAYEQYMGVLNSNNAAEKSQAKVGLKNIFPYLNQAAYYYTSQRNNAKTEQFVEAYIDVSMHEAMQSEGLTVGADYATFAWMAATNNYNARKYAKAITYLPAYINSGEATRRSDAYNYMAKAYVYLNDVAHAQYVLEQGLVLYPDNLALLTTIINTLGEHKTDDTALQKYVTQAMRFKPNDEGLINIQAQLYERTAQYAQAAATYTRLRQLKPQSLEVARHLALNYYNAGVVYAKQASTESGKEARQAKQVASDYFTQAANVLSEVLHNDPLAINYAYALANAYAYVGDTERLQAITAKIQALGYSSTTIGGSDMQLMDFNAASKRPNLVAAAPAPTGQSSVQNTFKAPAPVAQTATVPKPTMLSDVDTDIPINPTDNVNTFAIIIANEKYTRVAEVPNAENDGNMFAEYCHKVLGIPSDNIRKHLNVTFGGLLDAVEDMKAIAAAKHGQCNFIVYYAGHGVPDEKSKSAYILPVDADGRQLRVCYSLASFYAELAAMQANCVTVFLDACFSGATRDEKKMLMSARSVAIAVDDDEVAGNLVVFSAATSDQSALAYDEQKHGMFTYYLLKKLKETRGDVTLHELGNYVRDEVTLQARLKNHKSQTPTVTSGLSLGDKWKNYKLK